MARGRKKGETKTRVIIREEFLAPYYLTQDEKQYTVMKEGSTLGQGYYGSFSNAVTRVAELLMLEKSNETVSLKEYIETYDNIKSEIVNAVSL